MRVFDETMSDQKEVENEGPVTEIKVPRAKIRVTSHDRTPSASPIRKITIRQSSEDNSKQQQQANYEIISQNHSKQMEVLTETPTMMKLARYEIQPAQSPINNGLDPVAMDLISSTGIPSSIAGSEYSDKSDDTYGSPKISREMKNLQKSTNNSKILSDYLMDESPRRSRKTKEIPLPDPDEDIEEVEEEVEEEEEEELKEMKHSPVSVTNENVDSDTTLILPMEPPENRRKSVSRSRSRARSSNVRGRKKSIARQLKDELLLTSDKDEAAEEEEEEDQMSEVSYITNRSLEGRAVNPPPKVSSSEAFRCAIISIFHLSARLGLVLLQMPRRQRRPVAGLLEVQMFVPSALRAAKSHSEERRRVRLSRMQRTGNGRKLKLQQVRTRQDRPEHARRHADDYLGEDPHVSRPQALRGRHRVEDGEGADTAAHRQANVAEDLGESHQESLLQGHRVVHPRHQAARAQLEHRRPQQDEDAQDDRKVREHGDQRAGGLRVLLREVVREQ